MESTGMLENTSRLAEAARAAGATIVRFDLRREPLRRNMRVNR
jgi:hypothetical protein